MNFNLIVITTTKIVSQYLMKMYVFDSINPIHYNFILLMNLINFLIVSKSLMVLKVIHNFILNFNYFNFFLFNLAYALVSEYYFDFL